MCIPEVAAVSSDLSALGVVGLDALGQAGNGDQAWKAQQSDRLTKIETTKPGSQLNLIPLSGVRRLVEAKAAAESCAGAAD